MTTFVPRPPSSLSWGWPAGCWRHWDPPFVKVSIFLTFFLFSKSWLRSRPTIMSFRLFICEGDIEYTGCGYTEHRGLRASAAVIAILPRLAWGKVCGACFELWWKLKRACHTEGLSAQLQAAFDCSCFCSLHLVMLIVTNTKACQNSVYNLCGMKSSQMALPGSWSSATYELKNKFKALNALLKKRWICHNKGRVFCSHD